MPDETTPASLQSLTAPLDLQTPVCYRYWGKARSVSNQVGTGAATHHPLPCHCLDVAAVGLQLLRASPSLSMLLARNLAVSDVELERWLSFWLALHDLGKFSEAFQSQRPDLFAALRGRPPNPAQPYTVRHDSLGMWFWRDVLGEEAIAQQWFGPLEEDHRDGLDCWARAVTGHHGQPPIECGWWRDHFDLVEDRVAVAEFVAELRRLLLGTGFAPLSKLDPEALLASSLQASWWVAGVAVFADWLGSNTEFFPYYEPAHGPIALQDYWVLAQDRALAALDSSGVLARPVSNKLPLRSMFPGIAVPSPLQAWASNCELAVGPQIHLLEDVTGAGKTEAAVMLAHRLMAAGTADGLFIGLPTMATANAMYARIAQVHAMLFEGRASLILANSQRHLVDAFADSAFPASEPERDARQADESATTRCAAWLADHNKRALLAPAGVGTIDQALMAVLQSKHQSLRLLGLAHKVLLVDEVHACDDYMLGVLKVLLEFHSRAGGSAILLSATLPQRMKEGLLRAFAKGCAFGARDASALTLASKAYPLVTSWSAADPSKPRELPVETRPEVCRSVTIRSIASEEDAVQIIHEALAAGHCVCWMRNTVADALAAHARFGPALAPERLMLFHARYTLRDRLDMEEAVLAHFGRDSRPEDRAGRLLIATQVVEQSLDLDFDLVVTDLAPIDRIIQRAGRLCRHPRDRHGLRLPPGQADERGTPCLCLLGPAWAEAPGAQWFKEALPKAAAVYPHHGQLWLTARALRSGTMSMPADARNLIEGVFGAEAEVPPGLQANANAAEGQGYAAASQAQANTIHPSRGYERGGIDWWSDARTPTRLGEASVTVLLALWDGDHLRPWVEGRHAWAYSSVRVAERLIAEAVTPDDARLDGAIERLMPELPAAGKWSVLLVMTPVEGAWTGSAWTSKGRRGQRSLRHWCYEELRGLQPQNVTQGGEDE
jgi:CRISPR-associated endonuclease/helicase Cas3